MVRTGHLQISGARQLSQNDLLHVLLKQLPCDFKLFTLYTVPHG
jgi:hypothetical protein